MSGPAITVAVASCGRPDDLEICLRALRAQSRPADEVIVIDQDPSKAAREAVERSALRGARYLAQERRGLSASRNLALAVSAGDVLAVTDDDCAPDAGWLRAIAAALGREPRPGGVTGPILPLGDPPPDSHAVSLRESQAPVDHAGRMQPWGVGSGGNFAAPVAVLRELGGWDERLGAGSAGMAAEDADLLYRLLIAGEIVRYDPDSVVRHAWQTRERRMATRWSYGYGIGAMCGLWLARRDLFALCMLAGYARLHVRPLLVALARRQRDPATEHARALISAAPGVVHGLRSASVPARSPAGAAE